MCEYIVGDRLCKVSSGTERYCHIHMRSSRLINKLKAQKTEITILNKRLSESNRKLQIIDQADRIKYQLSPYAIDRGFRQVITDTSLKSEVERIFNAPFGECLNIYDTLINKRDMLAHRYTARNWVDSGKKNSHGKSIKQLCHSLKTYELLRPPLNEW